MRICPDAILGDGESSCVGSEVYGDRAGRRALEELWTVYASMPEGGAGAEGGPTSPRELTGLVSMFQRLVEEYLSAF